MKSTLPLLVTLILALCLPSRLGAQQVKGPADMRISAFDAFQANIDTELSRKIDAEYAEDQKRIDLLSKPHRIGQIVTVTIRRGVRRGQKTGVYRSLRSSGISGTAMIGDLELLLEDIDPLDQERLKLGKHPEQVTQRIRGLKDELARRKEGKKKLWRGQLFEDAGYTKEFFDSTVPLGPHFRWLSDLGHRSVRLTIAIPPEGEYAQVVVSGKIMEDNAALLLVGKKPLGSTLVAAADGKGKPAYEEEAWGKFEFNMLKDDLRGARGWSLLGSPRLWVMARDAGHWYLMGRQAVAPRRDRAGTVRLTYSFSLSKHTVKPVTAAMLRDFTKLCGGAIAYGQAIIDRVAAKEDATKAATAAALEEQRLKKLEEDKRAADALALEEQRGKLEKDYDWKSPKLASKAEDKLKIGVQYNSLDATDSINYPTTLGNREVKRLTKWAMAKDVRLRDRTRKLEVIGMQYRFVEVAGKDGKFVHMLQFAIDFACRSAMTQQFSPLITFTLADGSEAMAEPVFSVRRSWFGHLVGTQEFTYDQMVAGLKSIALAGEKKKEAPAPL